LGEKAKTVARIERIKADLKQGMDEGKNKGKY
jgi:hypothetical protein